MYNVIQSLGLVVMTVVMGLIVVVVEFLAMKTAKVLFGN